MKGMHTATRVPKITLLAAPSCLAGLLLRIKGEKMGFLALKTTVPECLHWYGLIQAPYAISYLVSYPITQDIPWKPELGSSWESRLCSGTGELQKPPAKNRQLKKHTGKRGAGLWGGKAMCYRFCETSSDPSPSLITSPCPALHHRHFWTFPLEAQRLQKIVSLLRSLNTDLRA